MRNLIELHLRPPPPGIASQSDPTAENDRPEIEQRLCGGSGGLTTLHKQPSRRPNCLVVKITYQRKLSSRPTKKPTDLILLETAPLTRRF